MSQVLERDVAAQPERLWSRMPGWGIVADLTPPELIASRRLRVLRRGLIVVLVVVVALCAAGYAYGYVKHRSASHDLAAETSTAASLRAQQKRYDAVVTMQATTAQINDQIAKLMTGDVNIAPLIDELRHSLPATMTMSQLTISLNADATKDSTSTNGGVLDTSAHAHIGTITITGLALRASDVATFVDHLSALKGVVEPYPLTNEATDGGMQYSIELTLTDELYSHLHDVTTKNGVTTNSDAGAKGDR